MSMPCFASRSAATGWRPAATSRAVSTLCGLIAQALSTIFFSQTGSNGERFKGVLADYYPWRLQPKGGVSQEEAITALYSDYRNPLAHAWAVSTTEVGMLNKRIVIDGDP